MVAAAREHGWAIDIIDVEARVVDSKWMNASAVVEHMNCGLVTGHGFVDDQSVRLGLYAREVPGGTRLTVHSWFRGTVRYAPYYLGEQVPCNSRGTMEPLIADRVINIAEGN